MASPNKGDDRDMAVLNFLASLMMEASKWIDLVSTSTHVETGSQQFDNLGQYVMSDQVSAKASLKMVYLPLSAIVMGLTLPVRL
jgi:hypothetical protein